MAESRKRESVLLYFKAIYEQNQKIEEKLDELIRVTCRLADAIEHSPSERQIIYGITGLQEFLNCSESTAKRIKSSGILDPATSQINRTIVFDAQKVLELLRSSKSTWTYLGGRKLKSMKK